MLLRMWSFRLGWCVPPVNEPSSKASYCRHGCLGHRCHTNSTQRSTVIMLIYVRMLWKMNTRVLYLCVCISKDGLCVRRHHVLHQFCNSHYNLPLILTTSSSFAPKSTMDSSIELTPLFEKKRGLYKCFVPVKSNNTPQPLFSVKQALNRFLRSLRSFLKTLVGYCMQKHFIPRYTKILMLASHWIFLHMILQNVQNFPRRV